MSTSAITVVLVHGGFVDSTAWRRVVPFCVEAGLAVTAVQQPLTSLADDVRATRRAIERLSGSVVLVGHGYGGAVITGAAAGRSRVVALVFVAAFAPDAGDTLNGLLGMFTPSELADSLVAAGEGCLAIERAKFARVCAGDVSSAVARALAARQRPMREAIFDQTVEGVGWRTLPSWYLVASADRVIHPELQRFLALRIGARMCEVDSSHVPFVSHPEQVAAVVLEAAREVERAGRARRGGSTP